MKEMKVAPEELIFMIGQLYVEKSKMDQVCVNLAGQVDKLTKKYEGDKKDGGTTTGDTDKRGADK